MLCASDVAARGLDVKDIDLVVNYDLPHSGDDYLHRTGRTGRAGAQGLAVSLVSAPEWNLMISIQRYLKSRIRAAQACLGSRHATADRRKPSPQAKPRVKPLAKRRRTLKRRRTKVKAVIAIARIVAKPIVVITNNRLSMVSPR